MINLRILDRYRVHQQQRGVFLVALTQTFPDLILLLLPKSMQHFFYTTTKKVSISPGCSLLLSSCSVLVTAVSSRPFLTSYYSVPQTRKKCVLTIQTVDFYRNIYIQNLDISMHRNRSTQHCPSVPASFLLTKSFLHTWRSKLSTKCIAYQVD